MFKLDTKEELTMGIDDRVLNLQVCESAAYIPMTISTPISLRPCIRKLPITATICGDPVLEPTPCGTFILTQKLYVKVPIEISIDSNIGSTPPCCGNLPISVCPPRPRYKNTPNVIIDKQPC